MTIPITSLTEQFQIAYLVVTGPLNSGKSTFIQTINGMGLSAGLDLIAPKPNLEMSQIAIPNDGVLQVVTTPESRRFDYMWEILPYILGFIVMMDSATPETFFEARSVLEIFRWYSPASYVVAANKQDFSDAWSPDDLRIALRIPNDIPVVSCVATDKESVKNVLLALLTRVLEEIDD